jgi:hypothetical protein
MRHFEIHFTGFACIVFSIVYLQIYNSSCELGPCYHSNNVWSVIVVHGEKQLIQPAASQKIGLGLLKCESCFFHNSSFHLRIGFNQFMLNLTNLQNILIFEPDPITTWVHVSSPVLIRPS